MAEVGTRAAVFERIIDDPLQCSICLDLYKEPKTLTCLHRFCMQCLINYRQSDRVYSTNVTCPICRRQTSVPRGDIRSLATDFILADVVEMVQREHKIPPCSVHEERKCELFCETCTKLICLTCLTESHKRHNFKEVRCMNVTDKSQAIEDKVQHYEIIVENLDKGLHLVDKQKQDFKAVVAGLTQEIEDEARQLKDKVDDNKQNILSQLDEIKMERKNELKKYSGDLQFKRETAQKHLEEFKLVLEANNKYDVLQSYTGLSLLGDNRYRIPSLKNNPDVRFTPCKKDIPSGRVSKHDGTGLKVKGLMEAVFLVGVIMLMPLATFLVVLTWKLREKMVLQGMVTFIMVITLVVMMIGETTVLVMTCWVIKSMFCIL